MSVKESLVTQGSSALIILAPIAVAHAPKACWEMEQHVWVSVGIQYGVKNVIFECVMLEKLLHQLLSDDIHVFSIVLTLLSMSGKMIKYMHT